MLGRIRSRIAAFFGRGRMDHELDEEMSLHIELLARDLMAQGMEPRAARREAQIRFGSVERAKARVREERGLGFFDEAARNLRFGLRAMRRSPLFTAAAVLTLGLCIGLSAAVFDVVHAVLWRPLPYPDADGLAKVVLYKPATGKNQRNDAIDGAMWERIRDEGAPLERAVYSDMVTGVNLSTDREAVYVQQQRVGAGWFHALGVAPALGREFTAEEDVLDGPRVAVLSHALWTRTFGGDPAIVGTTVRLKGEAFTVIGVMPESFRTPGQGEIWTPLRPSPTGEGGGTNYQALIRLPRGMPLETADARLRAIEPDARTARNFPDQRFGLLPLRQALTDQLRVPMLMLLGAVLLMLAIGCANLAGLQTARALARRAEMATRRALGGGASALTRQVLTETLLLGGAGGVLGAVLGWAALAKLSAIARAQFGLWQDIRMDGPTVLVLIGMTLVATAVSSIAPLAYAARARGTLVAGVRGTVGAPRHVLRRSLLVGEVAMVTALLFAAGLLLRSYGHLRQLDPGFSPDELLTVQYSLDDARYADADKVNGLFSETIERIGALPGVSSAAVALSLPYERPLNMGFRLPSEDEHAFHLVNLVYVTPGFFRTLGVPVLQGRSFDEHDDAAGPTVALVNAALVARDFKERTPLGESLEVGFGPQGEVQIVGVAGNVQQAAGWSDNGQPVSETPTIYVPAAQASSGFFRGMHVWFSPSWIIRASGAQPDLAARVTQIFHEVDPDLPVARVASARAVMDRAFAIPRFEAAFVLLIAAFALALAAVGLYGLIAHQVVQRRTEMGLRMALGATPGSAVWTAASEGLRLTVLGLGLGGVLCVGVARLMTHLIYGITAHDPVALAGLLGAVLALAVVASFAPALRLARVDPAKILREG